MFPRLDYCVISDWILFTHNDKNDRKGLGTRNTKKIRGKGARIGNNRERSYVRTE